MLRQINSKDKSNFIYFCQYRDPYSDFFITKDNKRLYLTNNKNATIAFNDCIKHGNKCFIKEENNEIKAVLLVVGFMDKFERKHIKVLAKSKHDVQDLFAFLKWQDLKDLFMEVKATNTKFVKYDERNKRYKPSYALRRNGFEVIAVRNRHVLLKKEERKFRYNKLNYNKDRE